MASKYSYPVDPYSFSFENLLNRVLRYGEDFNIMYAEKRGPEQDIELLAEYERLTKTGIHSYSAETVIAKTSLKLVHKKENMVDNDLSPDLIMQKFPCPITIFPKKIK